MPGNPDLDSSDLVFSLAGCKIERAIWDEREEEVFLLLDDGRMIYFSGFGIDDTGGLDVTVIAAKKLTKRQRLLLGGS